jgi:predicted HAD superfamily hydrolase
MVEFYLDALYSQADKAEVVSFDFFDTLFLRAVIDPEDVFDVVGSIIGVRDFRTIRRTAQTNAFVQMHNEGRKEISLADIYAHLLIKDTDSRDILKLELEVEKKVSIPNKELIPFFRHVFGRKKIIITSDMYLPKNYFVDSLNKFDLGPVDVFVSCEENCTKRDSGELFDYISTTLGVPPQKILHIGDNYVSDVERAKGKGLDTFYYQNSQIPPTIPSLRTPEYSLSRGLVKNHPPELHCDSEVALGYHYAGPAALGYYEWIKKKATEDEIDHVLLLSRDGYIVDRVLKFDDSPIDIPFSYFKGTRTVFSLASITDANFDDYLPFLLSGSHGLHPSELLTRLNVPLPEAKVFDDLGFSDGVEITTENMHLMRELLSIMRWEILKVCRENARGVRMSLAKIGIRSGQRLALVDIGWNGTTQEAFENAVSSMMSVDVFGYYLVLNNSAECLERQKRSNMKAMLSISEWSEEQIKEFYDNRVAVELLFSAPHHSITSLRMSDALCVTAQHDPRRFHNDGLLQTIGKIIEGSEKFASDFYRVTSELQLRFNEASLILPLFELLRNGKWKTEPVFQGVKDFDDWALMKERKKSLVTY